MYTCLLCWRIYLSLFTYALLNDPPYLQSSNWKTYCLRPNLQVTFTAYLSLSARLFPPIICRSYSLQQGNGRWNLHQLQMYAEATPYSKETVDESTQVTNVRWSYSLQQGNGGWIYTSYKCMLKLLLKARKWWVNAFCLQIFGSRRTSMAIYVEIF